MISLKDIKRLVSVTAFAAAGAFATIALAPQASALPLVGCSGVDGSGVAYDINGNVSTAISCLIDEGETQDTETIVNTSPGYFNETNWSRLGKIGTNDGPVDLTTNGSGTGQSGTFDLSGLADPNKKFMLVFKDGQGTTLVGYLLGGLVGTWTTPFTNPPFTAPGSGSKDVSHVSVYSTSCPPGSLGCGPLTSVPVPAGLPLMLTAIGLGAYMRKRARKAA